MILGISQLNDLIDKCGKKLMLTLAEKQIYRFYNLHKWLLKNGFSVNVKNYNFSKILAKITQVKKFLYIIPAKNTYFFQKNNEYLSYRSKKYFVLANSKILKFYHNEQVIASIICEGQLRSFVKDGFLKVNGKRLSLILNEAYEKLLRLDCQYERRVKAGRVILSLYNQKATKLFKDEKFYEYTKNKLHILNRLLCNNPYYNNYPYLLKSKTIKAPALYNFSNQDEEVAGELPSKISVLCPEKFNPKKFSVVDSISAGIHYYPKADEFFKCYFNQTISFFIFKKKALLRLDLNGEKCLIKKGSNGLKFIFEFGVVYLFCNAKILSYGIVDGNFIARLESKGQSISCNLGLQENKSGFFENFSRSVKLKKLSSIAEELLCSNPFETLKMCLNSFFIKAREVLKEETSLDDNDLFKLLLMAQEQIKIRINLKHLNKHILAILPFVNPKNKLRLLNLTQLISSLPSMRSLVQSWHDGKTLTFTPNEINLSDAVELEEMLNLCDSNENSNEKFIFLKTAAKK